MRINVYAEEILPGNTEIIRKQVETNEGTIETFYGVRMYLASSHLLHHSENDDDRSAITFWVKWTKKDGNNPLYLNELFYKLRENILIINDEITNTLK